MSAKKRVARFRGRSSTSHHPIEVIHGQGEALKELGISIERLIYKFRRIPDDAGSDLRGRCARLRMEPKWNFIFRMIGVWERSENSRRTIVAQLYPS